MKNGLYHYTECGLDNVFLANGFTYRDTPRGRTVTIHNIDGLHEAIGRFLAKGARPLTGKEIRFLRTELLLSQRSLGKLLAVTELTVARWEKGERPIPRSAEFVTRCMYAEHIGARGSFTKLLEKIADLEDEIDEAIRLEETAGDWQGKALEANTQEAA